jgi:methyltransferase (TIGR00027 family)
MEQKSMTALISAFSRWYHAEHNEVKIFVDTVAENILSYDEKQQIAANMSAGIGFFNPSLTGTPEEALRWIVDNQLSPSTLGRSAWAEKALHTAVMAGARQYLIIAAGYDTFAYRQPVWASNLQIFEIDHPLMSVDKQKRVQGFLDNKPGNLTYIPVDLTTGSLSEALYSQGIFDKDKLSFYSLLGIAYYLTKENFTALLHDIVRIAPRGCTVVFDYPDEFAYTQQAGERAKKQAMLASGAGESMLAGYSYMEMEQLLSDAGFLVYEHLSPGEITKQYFDEYNDANPEHPMSAFDNTDYCLAVRK